MVLLLNRLRILIVFGSNLLCQPSAPLLDYFIDTPEREK